MNLKNISLRNVCIAFGSILFFIISSVGILSTVYAVDFGVSFSPAENVTTRNTTTNITLSFNRAVYADTDGTAFDETSLAGLITLKVDDAEGADIPFAASISDDNTTITINPTDALTDGVVYAAIADDYYDTEDNQGDAANSSFAVATPEPVVPPIIPTPTDTTSPTVSFSPASAATVEDATTNVVLTFDEPIYQDTDSTAFDATALGSFVTLKSTDAEGADIPFTVGINTDNTVITIEPTSDLVNGVVYAAITDGYYDTADNQGAAATNSFTVAVPEPASTETEAIPPADTTAPTVSFTPASGATVTDATVNTVLTFSEPIYQDTDSTAFDTAALASIITLKNTDADGDNIPFTVSINAENTAITIDPTNDLADGTVYAAITDGYYDAADNQGAATTNAFIVSVPAPTPTETTPPTPTDTTSPTVSFSPASAATVEDATTNVVLTFDEPIYRDTDSTAFDATALGSFVTLKVDDAEGADIAFTVGINTDNTVITIEPTSDLVNGVVYAAITDGYYDAADNQGATATNSFTVAVPEQTPVETTPPADTTAPTVSFTPASGATVTDVAQNIVLTFSEVVKKDSSGTDFANTDLAGILTLKTTDANGTDIAYTATISTDAITIDPTDDLADGIVYAAITDGYYDEAGNQGDAANNSFTVAATEETPPVTPPVTPIESEEFTVTISPAKNTVIDDPSSNITLTFNQAMYKDARQTVFTTNDLAGLIKLRTDDVQGYGIPFAATINDANTVITINPDNDFSDGDVYVSVSQDYHAADGTRGVSEKSTFTVDTGNDVSIGTDLFSLYQRMFRRPPIAPSTALPTIEQTYTLGMFNDDIRLAQNLLDLSPCPLSVTGAVIMLGYLDVMTERALVCYQQLHRADIEITGTLTPETFNKLVSEYYDGQGSIFSNRSIVVTDDEGFRRAMLSQTLFLLRQSLQSLQDQANAASGSTEPNQSPAGTEETTETEETETTTEETITPPANTPPITPPAETTETTETNTT